MIPGLINMVYWVLVGAVPSTYIPYSQYGFYQGDWSRELHQGLIQVVDTSGTNPTADEAMANGRDEGNSSDDTGTADGVEPDDGVPTPDDSVATAHEIRAVATSRPCLYARQWDR
ncbi:hypothetical protein MGN70_003377 [Eutypa lata]|nr:hypothetical protein MGN70_003377 [Eutypa lata]